MDRCQSIVAIGFALIFLQTLFCRAAATNTANGVDDGRSIDTLPCSYRGVIITHGESIVDDCALCTCINTTITCNMQSCPIITCSNFDEPVTKKGECCESCPDHSTPVDVITTQDFDGCTIRGKRLAVGDVIDIGDCKSCTCKADSECEVQRVRCPPILCWWNRVYIEAECCQAKCAYDLPIWNVQPSEPTAITAGTLNNVMFDLVLSVNQRSGGTGASGDDLIKVSAWAADGSGNRVGYIDQVLTDGQASRDIHKPDVYRGFNYTIYGIEFDLDASYTTCSQMEYLCVEIAKGDFSKVADSRLTYTLEGVASETIETKVPSHLVGCIPFPTCHDADTIKQVSFSIAKKSGQIAPNPVAILGWSDEFNSVGGAFDSETGVFSSSVTGSFFFTYRIAETAYAQAPQVRLMKNDGVVLPAGSNSNSIILDLEVGDTVWLQIQGELFGSQDRYSTFSGFLI